MTASSNVKLIRIGTASCGMAAGAGAVLELLKQHAGGIPLEEVGCIGHCYAEPLVEVVTDQGSVMYADVKPTEEAVKNILELGEKNRFAVPAGRQSKELVRVLKLAGRIDPVRFEAYTANGGYVALKKALEMTPEAVVNAVKASGLRGRGGGGFNTGMKWSFLAAKKADEKILICNADEGDPGAFMDRSLMESVPHQVLEGMLIAAYATGATKLFIYCRAEYPLAIKHLKIAIEQIYRHKLNVVGGRALEIIIKEGAGAFVCGEETALINSLEGKRGTPRFRPPFPTDSGWMGCPTMINNVETFGNVPLIIAEGPEAYASVGTEGSKGTKLFALAGDLKYPGLVEVPMGITLAEIVFDIGGADRDSVKAVQTGGPSGGCIPVELFDTPVDYDSLRSLGAIMGSGGMIVIGRQRCMVEPARYFLDFPHRESCGKCTFCRVGTKRMFETLERITAGNGEMSDIDFLENLGNKVRRGSLCGLGQTAPNPVLAALRYFRPEFEAHVVKKQCDALECNALVDVRIDKSNCIKCKMCIKTCPVGAISDDFVVDNRKCTRCNSCIEVCPKKTISRVKKGEGICCE
ncbi:NADH-ubiquinone oxidoreductase-F iron-sulfur binding region domain-containing protein [Victivallis sp. Marseille-Q1083]|uniref:NADH-ubiquinone oxidoreductase-F iron-sulfur binding region domain-containing protein n=1 Tax=Victivallis sp. Marseille-Q1083 TaxID=2717288 RepID=UPI00158DBB43|nr:NADH-ubiquinone oxidoreductase-F iron-sulfur binding region domain-containing protein [Victivallis sp. Marseille-Q1083]